MYLQVKPLPGQAVAYYGRVSTPKQKLEHQRELVQRWIDQEGIAIPPQFWCEDKEKRHKSAVRENFQRLLSLAREGKLEWIVIAAFDRWGIANIDEFFEFRKQLKDNYVRLWSVQDQLEMTGADNADVFRIIGLAVATTLQMGIYGDRNITKMLQMAHAGWHASKEHPYGTDMLCCNLKDRKPLFKVHLESKDLERSGTRVYRITNFDDNGKPTTEEIVTKMPPRDCKENGYRLVPSIDNTRIETVTLIFELYDQGLTPRDIGNHLHAMGRTYFGKFFGPHAIETILKNPAYLGKPAWGKIAVGTYRHALKKESTRPLERGRGDPIRYDKGPEHYVYPIEPVFDPETFITAGLWERVQKRLGNRPKRGPTPRRRSKVIHPLNGLLVCPDCGKRMVLSNAKARNGERINYFICGTYAKSGKIGCRPNSVRFSKVDKAKELCWNQVVAKLGTAAKIDFSDLDSMFQSAAEHGESFWSMASSVMGENWQEMSEDERFEKFQKRFANEGKDQKSTQRRIDEIDKELSQLADVIKESPVRSHRMKWHAESEELEREKERLTVETVSLLDRLVMMGEHAIALKKTLIGLLQTKQSALWETFVEKVIPVFETLETNHHAAKNATQRICTGFQFVPKTSASDLFPHVLEIGCPRRGRG